MASLLSRHITERTVLRVLITGFTLVVLLLGAASFIALQGTNSIKSNASHLVREQVATARLLHEVQAEQGTLMAVLHQLAHAPGNVDRHALLRELEQTDRALDRVAEAAQGMPTAAHWRALEQAAERFSVEARDAVAQGGQASQDQLAHLFTQHERVVSLVGYLLQTSEMRVTKAEATLERQSGELADESFALLGACLLMALLCAVLTVRMATASIRRIEWQARELSRVSWQMLQDQEAVARRFSHELHDELGQSLAAIKANLTSGDRQNLALRRADCVELVDTAIANVRELSQLLRPVILDDFGLDASLRWLTEKFAQRTGLVVRYESSFIHRLADETETHLFRIAQEALTNVARHANATEVQISLVAESGKVRFSVEDNGFGMKQSATEGHPSLGMVGMRARARQAGGELTVSTPSLGGLRLDVWVPATKEEHDTEPQDARLAG